jgi:hypothetical protein
MYLGYEEEHLNVSPQVLTPQGSRVERAVTLHKKQVHPPYYVKGHVSGDTPDMRIAVSEPKRRDIIKRYPYSGIEELYSIAEQSKVGTKKEVLYRLDARKSKEFSNITILNESWKRKVADVCAQVGQVLAPGAEKITSKLYKLLIYSEGDFFNFHQDVQHSAGMFATLLFTLPVLHTGGEVSLHGPDSNHEGHKIEDRCVNLQWCNWVAFYTDISHKVNAIKDGFRLVLNYQLSFEGVICPSSFSPRFSWSTAEIIRNYFLTTDNKLLAIPLTYQYTQATLSPAYLKGADACLFNALEEVAATELHYVLGLEKTKAILYDEFGIITDPSNEQIFQGVILVKHENVKKYFKIQNDYEQELVKAGDDKDILSRLERKRDSEFSTVREEVKSSWPNSTIEWIVEREHSGQPKYGGTGEISLRFEHGQMGWLGNTYPAEEYYYLQAAIVVRGKH